MNNKKYKQHNNIKEKLLFVIDKQVYIMFYNTSAVVRDDIFQFLTAFILYFTRHMVFETEEWFTILKASDQFNGISYSFFFKTFSGFV